MLDHVQETDGTNETSWNEDATGEEVRPFRVSRNIVGHLIRQQADSVPKAILELAMNAIDADAKTIDIDLIGSDAVRVRDDGEGWGSREEMIAHFEVFGFDHDTDAERARGRVYGRFGLGRGQILGFGAARWRSGYHAMGANVTGGGELKYRITDHETYVQGTQVDARLDEPLDAHTRGLIARKLKSHLAYTPAVVRLNGQRINTEVDDARWDLETDGLLFREHPHGQGGIEVYNQGVWVQTCAHYELGISGVLCSRPGHEFKLNTTRTGVMQGKCKLWRKARELIGGARTSRRKRSPRMNDADRMAIIAEMLAAGVGGGVNHDTDRIFINVSGHTMSARMVARHAHGRITVAPERGDSKGEAIHGAKSACVLAPEIPHWFDVESVDELANALNRAYRRVWSVGADFKPYDYEGLAAAYAGEHVFVDRRAWTPNETAAIGALGAMSRMLAYALLRLDAGIEPREPREVLIGQSPTATAWTDGATLIAIERGELGRMMTAGADGWHGLLNILVGQYMWTADNRESPGEGRELDADIVNVLMSPSWRPYTLVHDTLREWERQRNKLGLTMTREAARTFDGHGVVLGEDDEPTRH